MAGKTQKKAIVRKRVNKNDQILALLKGLDKKFTKNFNYLDGKFNGLDNKVTGLDSKVTGLDSKVTGLDNRLNSFQAETAHRFDDLELKILGFKDEILSVVDVVRKEYEETRQERLVMGAVQDRQQKEIETLKESASEQKQLLESLDARVTELEMNKAA